MTIKAMEWRSQCTDQELHHVPRPFHRCRRCFAIRATNHSPQFQRRGTGGAQLGHLRPLPRRLVLRYAGSTSGCGCDFSGCNSGRSRSALRDYLASVLPKAEVQVYACWEGDESVAIENRVTATIDDFVADEPVIGEGSLITLVHR